MVTYASEWRADKHRDSDFVITSTQRTSQKPSSAWHSKHNKKIRHSAFQCWTYLSLLTRKKMTSTSPPNFSTHVKQTQPNWCLTNVTIGMVAIYENDNDATSMKESQRKGKIVQETIMSEQCRSMYRKFRQILKPTTHGTLSQITVPRLKTTNELPEDYYQQFLDTTTKDNIEWDSILSKEFNDYNLLRFNRNHFRAALASPCGYGQIHEELTFTSLSKPAKELLDGTIPPQWYGNDAHLREFLTSFAITPKIKTMPPIQTTITEDNVNFGFRKWKETTTTSPSGRHLSHYKAIITDKVLLHGLTTFLNITITNGQVITRWCNPVIIMIEKDSGKPKVNRLQIIHLFEADFNLFLKLQWGSRLVKRAVNEDLLHPGQHARGWIP